MNFIRRILAAASASPGLREWATQAPFVQRAARRFLPGEGADEALSAAKRLGENGIVTLLTYLGEHIRDRAEAEAVTSEYLRLIQRIQEMGLPSDISVKLTQLGLELDHDLCLSNLTKLSEKFNNSGPRSPAGLLGNGHTVWIDMEESRYVDSTLELHKRARPACKNIGVCVQAYLRRTERDVQSLISTGSSVRLVKGAYSEPAAIAFPKKSDVDANYYHLARMLLSSEARYSGVHRVIATHDLKMIRRIILWAGKEGLAKKQLEFAMLYGIQRVEQLRLAREGYRSTVLVSYGSFWFPWFMRRLAERPANLLFLARNLFSS